MIWDLGHVMANVVYTAVQLSLNKWSTMTKVQRERYLQKLSKFTLREAKVSLKEQSLRETDPSSVIKVFNLCGKKFNADTCALSPDILQSMFAKAQNLLLSKNSICPSPGSSSAKMVESKSGNRPHFVTVKGNCKYSCDSDCAMWKCAKICSHTIACAFVDNQLQAFLSQATSTPNLYELSKSHTVHNPGKKPVKRKACSKSTMKAITEHRNDEVLHPVHHTIYPSAALQGKVHSTTTPCTSTQLFTYVNSPVTAVTSAVTSYPTSVSVVSQGNINATITSCNTVHLSTSTTRSPAVPIQQFPTATSTASTSTVTTTASTSAASSSQNISINQAAASALANIISQILSGGTSTLNMASSSTVSSIDSNYLFWIVLVSGNISRCQGCLGKIGRGADGKPLPPPDDLVVQHKEQVLFNNPNTGNYQLSREHRNVYYHAKLQCIQKKFPSFIPSLHCRMYHLTLQKITQGHKDYIMKEFHLRF